MTLLTAVTLTISHAPIPAMADSNKISGDHSTETNDTEVDEVEEDATLGTNEGTITENNGTVINNGSDDNEGSIQKNNESVKNNNETGTVDVNTGTIDKNDGYVGINLGEIKNNNGEIGSEEDFLSDETYLDEQEFESTSVNHGYIENNNSDLGKNAGPDDRGDIKYYFYPDGEHADLSDDLNIDSLTENYTGGNIKNNNSTIELNNGNVTNNNEEGSIIDNEGSIANNKGFVGYNGGDGSIDNNYGTVDYNYGGDYTGNDYNDSDDSIEITYGIENNFGTVNLNNGKIKDNKKDKGQIGENFDYVGTNNGIIDYNYNFVGTNNGTVENNSVCKVEEDTYVGEIEKNTGEVIQNDGFVYVNDATGEIVYNSGTVDINAGTIDNNNPNFLDSSGVNINIGTIKNNNKGATVGSEDYEDTGNFGVIENNNSELYFNAGENDTENIEDVLKENNLELPDDFSGAIVRTNNSTIVINNGTIDVNSAATLNSKGKVASKGIVENNNGKINQNGGFVETNKGTVLKNTGEVKNNSNTGIVANYENGVIQKNTGTVYNYGGKVVDKATGTEYFSISIVTGENITADKGNSGLKKYDGAEWLGQKGEETAYTEIIISPATNYEINSITTPNGVTATKLSDGTWSLKIASGTNITIDIPDASRKKSDPDIPINNDASGSDNESSSGSDGQNLNNVTINLGQKTNQEILLFNNAVTQPLKDSLGNPIEANLLDVLKPIANLSTAINYFPAQEGLSLSSDNVIVYGEISLDALFKNTTSSDVNVPVKANVVVGNFYEILLNNNKVLTVQCLTDGELLIPVGNGTGNLVFIVLDKKMAPHIQAETTTQEQTHNTVMGAEIGMAVLSAGNDFTGSATEGLSPASNVGVDGTSSFAQMGGGLMRQETG